MEITRRIVFLLASALIQTPIILAFAPTDNFLLNCGASSPATLDDRRVFISDESDLLSPCKSLGISDSHPSDAVPEIYRSARVFHGAASYHFRVENSDALHFVRLHFYALNSSSYDQSAARFNVSVGGFVLLSNFSLADEGTRKIMKEFVVKAKSKDLEITFLPVDADSIAFVNAIEVFSAPGDLMSDFILSKVDRHFRDWSVQEQPVESLHRTNIGGGEIAPINDALWRSWAADDAEFLQPAASPSRIHTFSGKLEYIEGGASRESAPDQVYRSSRVTNSSMTWIFPVNSAHKLLVRLHFCDFISQSPHHQYLRIMINDKIIYKKFDLTEATAHIRTSPYYIDVVVDSGRQALKIGVVPSSSDFFSNHLGFLNGLEIFKINYTPGSDAIDDEGRGKDFYICGTFITIFVVVALVVDQIEMKREEMPQDWLPSPVLDADGEKQEKKMPQAWLPLPVHDVDEEKQER